MFDKSFYVITIIPIKQTRLIKITRELISVLCHFLSISCFSPTLGVLWYWAEAVQVLSWMLSMPTGSIPRQLHVCLQHLCPSVLKSAAKNYGISRLLHFSDEKTSLWFSAHCYTWERWNSNTDSTDSKQSL